MPVPVAIALLLKVVGVEVYTPEETPMLLPENVGGYSVEIASAKLVSTVVLDVGNPEAVTTTEVPAEPDDGVRVTVGAVMVKVPATTEVDGSEMITVYAPGVRYPLAGPPITLPITKYPLRTPVALVCN